MGWLFEYDNVWKSLTCSSSQQSSYVQLLTYLDERWDQSTFLENFIFSVIV